jgi:hypothetical protein
MLKTLIKQKAESLDTNQKQMSENEEVISPEVRVGPAGKEKHSVSMQNVLKYFFSIGFGCLKCFLYFFQDYILTKHANLRNYVCIGNEDASDLDIDDIYGRQKGSFIGVEYVWFKIKPNIQLLCTRNEFHSNSEFIKKKMIADSDEYNTLNAESVNLQNSFYIKSYYKFMSDLNPPQKSRVVSMYNTYLHIVLLYNYIF